MKQIFFIAITAILLVFGSSCSNKEGKPQSNNNENIEQAVDFSWLTGKWERTNDEEGEQTFENWEKVSDSEYVGFGWTVQGSDTVFQEKIKLYKSDDNWLFGVISPEEKDYTIFKMTNISKESFTCENPEIEFPSKIKYSKEGEKIKASVSGKEMEITFDFKKITPE